MKPNYEKQLTEIILGDSSMMEILKIHQNLKLKDSWIGAGFIRNKVWNTLSHYQSNLFTDIDIIHFDVTTPSKEFDKQIEHSLRCINVHLNWSAKNQARMHLKNGHSPYRDSLDAISFWPETATAIAVKLNNNNQLEYLTPCGLEDLFQLVIRKSPKADKEAFKSRLLKKKWKERWEKVKIIASENY